jgi:hypothetical protein
VSVLIAINILAKPEVNGVNEHIILEWLFDSWGEGA